MGVFNAMWDVESITLYQVDQQGALYLRLSVLRKAQLCDQCQGMGWMQESGCGHCTALDIGLPVGESGGHLSNCVRPVARVWGSGLLSYDRAAALRQVRSIMKNNGYDTMFDQLQTRFESFLTTIREFDVTP